MTHSRSKKAGTAEKAPPFFTLLTGDDTVSRERARMRLLEEIRAQRGDVTVEVYDPEHQTVAELAERILTPSLFGGVRVFHVRHAESFDNEELAVLERVANAVLRDEYVVVEAGKPDEENRALAAFARRMVARASEAPEACQAVTFEKPPPWKMVEWLTKHVPVLLGRRIETTAAELLIERVGEDFDLLRSELEKIDLYLEPDKSITKEAVVAVVDETREAAVYELAQALGRKDTARALDLVERLFASSFYAPACIAAIFRHFWSLYRIKAFEESSPETVRAFVQAVRNRDYQAQTVAGVAIGKAAGLFDERQAKRVYPVLIKGGLVEQARSFSYGHLRAVFRWLYDIDVGVKTGRIEAGKPMMQALCVRIVRGPEGPEDNRAYAER